MVPPEDPAPKPRAPRSDATQVVALRQRVAGYLQQLARELESYRDLMAIQRQIITTGDATRLAELASAESARVRRMTDLARCINPILAQLRIPWPSGGDDTADQFGPDAELSGLLGRVEALRQAARADNTANQEALGSRLPEIREQLDRLRRRDPSVRTSRQPGRPSFIDLQA